MVKVEILMLEEARMNVGGSVVVFVIAWWLAFQALLPVGVRSPAEEGRVLDGDPGAPVRGNLFVKPLGRHRGRRLGHSLHAGRALGPDLRRHPLDLLNAAGRPQRKEAAASLAPFRLIVPLIEWRGVISLTQPRGAPAPLC